MENIEIEEKALLGYTKEAWEGLMKRVGLEYKDVPNSDSLWFNTASFRSSGKMIFVNDVLPREILSRDASQETKRLVGILAATSKAYNFSDHYTPDKFAECARNLEEIIPFVSSELRHKAYGAAANLYERGAGSSDDFTKETRKQNKIKQGECLLKAVEASSNQTDARRYADRYLQVATNGCCFYEYKSAYSPEALDKEIDLYEKVLQKPTDDKKLETILHNELAKGYTCKANRAGLSDEKKTWENKANEHKAKVAQFQKEPNVRGG